jgi:hypothetical protein
VSEIKVRIGQQSAIKVASTSAGAAGGTLSGLSDTDVSAVTNGSVLVYDANTSQWVASNTLTTGNSKNLDINGGSF